MGREDLCVALAAQVVRDEILKFLAKDGSTRGPENQPLANVLVDVEQLQIFAKFAMVSLFGFFHTMQRCFQRFFAGLNQPVDADQLLAVLVTSPIG